MSVRKAYKARNVEASRDAHSHRHRENHPKAAEYLGDLVLGGIDGIITTFAIVAGVEGAGLSTGIVLVLGAANLVADGFSMAVGNYFGAKSEEDYFKSERDRESWEIEHLPEHEVEEVREIYRKKKFSGELLEKIVEHITSDKDLWLDTMMRDELDIIAERRSPFLVGLLTLLSFVVFGAIPLSVYFIAYIANVPQGPELFWYCIGATGVGLFIVGALRSQFTFRSYFRSGMEILVLGGLAGVLSYFVGFLLRGLLG